MPRHFDRSRQRHPVNAAIKKILLKKEEIFTSANSANQAP